MIWQHSVHGVLWTANAHETWTFVSWVIYAALVLVRFVGHQGARQAAATAVAGFAFLTFAVVGVGAFQ
jgi:ABC-type transport system involved in cytochrome c biogenesis permease subunit